MDNTETKLTEKEVLHIGGVSKRDIYLATDKSGNIIAYDYNGYNKMYKDGTAINYRWKIVDGYVC